ncbi:MAG: LytTR family transcriptional regulator DNA-binding domain-containing protein [Rhodocyclales bacterium]|nr:LytTR family transcriptional regulator DNA-binding domain-containing protein [Rhodocyclales bacterium]
MRQQQYILNRLPIGIVILDREQRVLSFSGAAAAIFGNERMRASLGQTIQATHPEHSRSKIDWLLEQSREEGTTGYASMLINVPDRVLQLRMVQLGDGAETNGYCLILYDITDLTSRPAATEAPAGEDAACRSLYKLPVSLAGRIALLDIGDVAFLRADGHYTEVCAGGKHYFCSLSLSQLESRLPGERFVRVHRSYIINLAHASAVSRRDEQFAISIAGDCGHEIPVSRVNAPRLRELLGV